MIICGQAYTVSYKPSRLRIGQFLAISIFGLFSVALWNIRPEIQALLLYGGHWGTATLDDFFNIFNNSWLPLVKKEGLYLFFVSFCEKRLYSLPHRAAVDTDVIQGFFFNRIIGKLFHFFQVFLWLFVARPTPFLINRQGYGLGNF